MLAALVFAATLAAPQAPPPAAPPPEPLTLAQAIARARQFSPLRGAAAATADGAARAARVTGRPLNPLLDFRTENWTPSGATRLPLDVWATVTQPFELGGKRDFRRGVANAERDATAADLADLDRGLASQVTSLYLEALRAHGRVDGLTAHRSGLATVVETMRSRVREGVVAESALLRFEAEAARLDIDLVRGTLDLGRALDELAVAIGVPRLEAAQLVTPALPTVPLASDALIAAAVTRHPRMQAAESRVRRADQALSLEDARRIPDPAVSTGYKRTVGTTTVVAAVTATVPLFDRNGAARAVAAGTSRAASAERDATRARLASEIARLTRAAGTLADRAGRGSRDLLEPAAGVRDAARAAFQEGSLDVLALIDAERVYRDVSLVALDLQLEAIGAAVDARLALGEDPLP